MNTHKKILGLFFAMALSLTVASQVHAATPTLSANATGNGDSVTVNVTGDANSGINLSYFSGSMQMRSIGTTDGNGYFSTTISTSTYGITPGSIVYVYVNGQESAGITWPLTNTSLSLSQTSVTIAPGQTTTISAYNTTNALYVQTNTNQNIATINPSGSTITITGTNLGTSTVTICENGYTNMCGTIYVTVSTSGTYSSSLILNQTNPIVAVGQTTTITSNYTTGTLYVPSNTNASVATPTVSGSTIIITGVSAGSDTMTICENNSNNQCATVYITVTGTSYGSLAFSQNNVTVNAGQSLTIYAYTSGGANVSLTSNSNPGIASISTSGTSIIVYGNSAGYTTATLCQTNTGTCGTLSITVSGTSYTSGILAFTQQNVTNLTLLPMQMVTLTGSNGGNTLSVSSNSNSLVAGANVNGASLIVAGITPGVSTITICQSGTNQCGAITVTVVSSTPIVSTITPTTSSSTITYLFTQPLRVGSTGVEVTHLQEKLTSMGFYSGPITGTFGSLTENAVIALQAKYGLAQLGSVGPGTRDVLNRN